MKFFLVLKRIQIKLISDIKITLKILIDQETQLNIKKKKFNPNRFKIKNNHEITNYLKLFDIFGEFSLLK